MKPSSSYGSCPQKQGKQRCSSQYGSRLSADVGQDAPCWLCHCRDDSLDLFGAVVLRLLSKLSHTDRMGFVIVMKSAFVPAVIGTEEEEHRIPVNKGPSARPAWLQASA